MSFEVTFGYLGDPKSQFERQGGAQKAFAKKRRKHKLRGTPGLAVWVPKKGKMSTESKARASKQEVRDGSDTPDVPTARWRISQFAV